MSKECLRNALAIVSGTDDDDCDCEKCIKRKGLDTELMKACKDNKSLEDVQILIHKGADPGRSCFCEDQDDCDVCIPASMFAVQNKRLDLVKLFVSKGVNVNRLYGLNTPLRIACDNKDWKMIKFLVQECKVDVTKGNVVDYPIDCLHSPILQAIIIEDYKLTHYLLTKYLCL